MDNQAALDRFTSRFNDLVGRHTGNYAPQRTVRTYTPSRYIGPSRVSSARSGTFKPDNSHDFYESFGDTATRQYTQSLTNSNSALDSVTERNAKIQETFEDLVEKDDNFQNSIAGRVLDLLSRPAYAVNEALRVSRENENAGDKGEMEEWGDTLGGLWAGLSGRKKTGFGEYIAEHRKGEGVLGTALNELDEEHPEISKWVDRGLGFGGEMLLDPLNVIGGGSAGIARNTGEVLTREGIEEVAEQVAKRGIDEVFQGRKLPSMNRPGMAGGRVPGKQALTDLGGQEARNVVKRITQEVTGGPNRGKIDIGRGATADTIANAVADSVRAPQLAQFEGHYNQLITAIKGGKRLTPRQIKNFVSYDPKFRDFWDEALIQFNKTRPINPVATMDEAMLALSKTSGTSHIEEVFRRAAQVVRDNLDDTTNEVFRKMSDEFTNFYYNAPTIRVGNKHIPIRFIGRAYQRVAKPLKTSTAGHGIAEAMSYSSKFPGRVANVGQRIRSTGARFYDQERKTMRELWRGISHEDALRVGKAIDDNVPLPDPKLEAIRIQQKEMNEALFDVETASRSRGRNGEGLRMAEDYNFVFNKGGKKADRTAFKKARKEAVAQTGSTKGYQMADAKAAGLKPVEHPGEAYLYRVMKHNRDQSKVLFLRDMIDHYGIQSTDLSENATRTRNIRQVPESWIGTDIRDAMKNPNAKIYLPEEVWNFHKYWDDLTKMDNDSLGQLRRGLTNVINKYKTVVTLPLPGFHIRNMTFDFFMGLVDGVPTRTYMEIMGKFPNRASTSFTIAPGISKSWDEMRDAFLKNAQSGGFYHADIAPSTTMGRVRNIPNKAREIAEFREDGMRFAHFIHAVRDETRNLAKKRRGASADELFDEAVENAVYRVNHYHFDYGALTAFERQNMKLAFPFYTFARKSVPMMIEALFISPKLFARTYRTLDDPRQDMGDSGGTIFNNTMMPSWLREIGYAQLTEEKEPWVVGGDVLPTGPLNTIDWPFNSGADPNTRDFFQSVLSQVNPFANMVYEQTLDKRVFSGQQPGSLTDQLVDMLAPYGSARSMVGGDKSTLEQLLSNRLLTGMSTRKVTEEQQGYSEQELVDRTIDDPFRDFNYSQDRYRVYRFDWEGSPRFRITDQLSNKIIYETDDPREALRKAQELPQETVNAGGG